MNTAKKIKNIFLKNNTPRQTILKNSFWLTFGNLFLMISKLSISVLFANKLGSYQFGVYSYILTITSFFQFFITYGIPTLIITELAKENKTIDLKSIINAKIILLIPLVFFLSIFGLFFSEKATMELLIIYSITLLIQSVLEIIYSIFRSQEKMEKEALLKIIDAITTFLLVIFGLNLASETRGIFVLLLVQSIIMLLVGYAYSKETILKNPHQQKEQNLQIKTNSILKMSFMFALNDILVVLYQKILLLITKVESSIEDLGIFNGSYQLISYSLIAFNIISVSVIPSIIKHSNDPIRLSKIKQTYLLILSAISFILLISLFIISFFISDILGKDFKDSGSILRLLTLVYLFKPLSYYWGNMLTIIGRQKYRAITQLIVSIIGTPIFILLISRLGSTGSAISVLFSEVMICFGYFIFYKKSHSNH